MKTDPPASFPSTSNTKPRPEDVPTPSDPPAVDPEGEREDRAVVLRADVRPKGHAEGAAAADDQPVEQLLVLDWLKVSFVFIVYLALRRISCYLF